MATTDGQQFVEATNNHLHSIEAAIANHVMPDDGRTDRQIQSSVLWMENEVMKLNNRLNVDALNQVIDAKISTAFELLKTVISNQITTDTRSDNRWHRMPVLESKSMIDIGTLEDGKSYRAFNRKMTNAMDQIRPLARESSESLEMFTESMVHDRAATNPKPKVMEVIIDMVENNMINNPNSGITKESLEELNRALWSVINAKAVDKSEAMSKIKAVHQGEGLWAYVRIHQWFSKTTDQGKNNRRMLVMIPELCKHDHEIVAAVEEWGREIQNPEGRG